MLKRNTKRDVNTARSGKKRWKIFEGRAWKGNRSWAGDDVPGYEMKRVSNTSVDIRGQEDSDSASPSILWQLGAKIFY